MDVVLGGYLGWFGVFERMIGVKVLDAARTPLLAAWAERFAAGDAAEPPRVSCCRMSTRSSRSSRRSSLNY